MKLVVTFGSFNPPTKADRALFDAMAEYIDADTDCIILTDVRFDDDHLMGVLEKNQTLYTMIETGITVHMEYDSVLAFLAIHGDKYDHITYLVPTTFDTKPGKMKQAIASKTKTEVILKRVDVGDTTSQKFEIMTALKAKDFDHFDEYYGGSQIDAIQVFNNMKDRVVWKNAKAD